MFSTFTALEGDRLDGSTATEINFDANIVFGMMDSSLNFFYIYIKGLLGKAHTYSNSVRHRQFCYLLPTFSTIKSSPSCYVYAAVKAFIDSMIIEVNS